MLYALLLSIIGMTILVLTVYGRCVCLMIFIYYYLMISYISVVLKSLITDASCIVLDFSVRLFGNEQFFFLMIYIGFY